MRQIALAIALSLAASACGQRGDLYLRENPPPGVKPAPDIYQPVPYPPQLEESSGERK